MPPGRAHFADIGVVDKKPLTRRYSAPKVALSFFGKPLK